VVVDNTNLYKVLTAGFVNYAAARGYEVEIVRLMAEVNDCHSIHGVPAEQIGFMSMNFQDYPAERIVKREEVSG